MLWRYFIFRKNGVDSLPRRFNPSFPDEVIYRLMMKRRKGGQVIELDYTFKPLPPPASMPAPKPQDHEPDLRGHIDRY
ncbi:MAG: hypothetical protein V4486_01220 [Patescibacteria group bacterium]